jgi:hypothetical protein
MSLNPVALRPGRDKFSTSPMATAQLMGVDITGEALSYIEMHHPDTAPRHIGGDGI